MSSTGGSYEMTSLDIQRANGVAALQSRRSRLYEIEAKYILDTDQDTPLRVLHGRDFISGTQLMPIFGLETHEGSSGGKDSTPTQTTYYAGVALAICCGRLDKILKIENSDDVIWDDEIALSQNGANQLDISVGNLRIYPGSMEQGIDSALESITVVDRNGASVEMTHPAYRGVAYFVCDKFYLGNQNAMPNIRFECQRIPKALEENTPEGYVFPWTGIELPGEVESNATLFPHCTTSGDMYPPEIIYDFLTNTFYGAGLDSVLIDYDSFIQAQYTCVNEGIYISSVIDQQSSLQDIIAQFLEYVDGILTIKNGLISIKLLRWNDAPLQGQEIDVFDSSTYLKSPDLSVNNLIEEPSITVNSSDTNNVTIVTFNDRLADYESTSESFECHLARRSYGDEIVSYSIDRPFAKSRKVASKIAKRIGFARAFPSIEITCKTIIPIPGPTPGSVANVGDLVTIGYDKLKMFETEERYFLENEKKKPDALLRIYQILYGAPDDPVVTYVCRLHRRYNPQIEEEVHNSVSIGGTILPTILKTGGWLHPHILLADEYRYTVLNGRVPGSAMTGYKVNICEGIDGQGSSYVDAGNIKDFPIPAQLLSMEVLATGIKMRLMIQKKIDDEITEYFSLITNQFAGNGEFYLYTSAFRKDGEIETQTGKNMKFKSVGNIESDITNVNKDANDIVISYTVQNSETVYLASDYYVFYVTVTPWVGYIKDGIGDSQPIETVAEKKFYPSSVFYLTKKELGSWFRYDKWDKDGENLEKKFSIKAQALFGKYGVEPLEVEEGADSSCVPQATTVFSTIQNSAQHEIGSTFDTVFNPVTWGNIVLVTGGGNVTNGEYLPVTAQSSGEGESTNSIYIDNSTGIIYSSSDGENWTIIGHSGSEGLSPIDSRYQLAGETCEKYYLSYTQTATMEHESGKDGVVHLHAVDTTPIELTVPAASTASTGDKITIIFTAADGVEVSYDQDRTPRYIPSGIVIESSQLININVGVGMVLHLVCTAEGSVKKWLPILLSKSN